MARGRHKNILLASVIVLSLSVVYGIDCHVRFDLIHGFLRHRNTGAIDGREDLLCVLSRASLFGGADAPPRECPNLLGRYRRTVMQSDSLTRFVWDLTNDEAYWKVWQNADHYQASAPLGMAPLVMVSVDSVDQENMVEASAQYWAVAEGDLGNQVPSSECQNGFFFTFKHMWMGLAKRRASLLLVGPTELHGLFELLVVSLKANGIGAEFGSSIPAAFYKLEKTHSCGMCREYEKNKITEFGIKWAMETHQHDEKGKVRSVPAAQQVSTSVRVAAPAPLYSHISEGVLEGILGGYHGGRAGSQTETEDPSPDGREVFESSLGQRNSLPHSASSDPPDASGGPSQDVRTSHLSDAVNPRVDAPTSTSTATTALPEDLSNTIGVYPVVISASLGFAVVSVSIASVSVHMCKRKYAKKSKSEKQISDRTTDSSSTTSGTADEFKPDMFMYSCVDYHVGGQPPQLPIYPLDEIGSGSWHMALDDTPVVGESTELPDQRSTDDRFAQTPPFQH